MPAVNDEAVEKLKKSLHRVWARSDASGDEFIRALTELLISQIKASFYAKPAAESTPMAIRLAEAVAREIMEGCGE
jgi:hypothetical protein